MDYEITRRSFDETRQRLTQQDLLGRIVEAGRVPVERDSLYNVVDEQTLADVAERPVLAACRTS